MRYLYERGPRSVVVPPCHRSASRAASVARWRAASALIFAPRIWLPQMTSRDLVLMAGDYSATGPGLQSTSSCASQGAMPLLVAQPPSGKCCRRWNHGTRRGVDSSLLADAAKTPGRETTSLQVGGPGLKTWGRFGSLDREMALHFSRVAPAKEELEIWSATERGFSFVVSNESSSGPGLHGQPGFVASWRPIDINRPAIRVGGSGAGGAKRRQRARIGPIGLPPTYSGQRIRGITLSKNSRAPSSSAGTGGNGYFWGSGACR
jgi:hypothetical protein